MWQIEILYVFIASLPSITKPGFFRPSQNVLKKTLSRSAIYT
jgi:hypothetical protein